MSFKKIENLISLTKGKKPLNIVQSSNGIYLPYVDIKVFETGIVDNYTDGEFMKKLKNNGYSCK